MEIALGVGFVESMGGYRDAVGDVDLVDTKWGPSVGWFQIRALRDPMGFNEEAQVRYARALLNPWFNAEAAFIISNGGTDWSKWSAFTSGAYLEHKGKDYELISGHERADKWSA